MQNDKQPDYHPVVYHDASAGIDIPAAGLFQAKAKEEGERMGIGYCKVSDLV